MRMPGLPRPCPGRSPRIPEPWCWYASAWCMSREVPPKPPHPRSKSASSGDRYTPVDTAGLDLGDHRAILTPPGGKPLVIATPMVAKATYDRARGGLVIVPSALGAQQLRDADWKGWSASWVSYVRALQPAKPVGFKVLGAQAPALRDWVIPRLSGERPAGTPSLTTTPHHTTLHHTTLHHTTLNYTTLHYTRALALLGCGGLNNPANHEPIFTPCRRSTDDES